MDNSIYKQCTECGQTKHISEFSKSYTNRCKVCVAEHTRKVRAAQKLTARVKLTGEIVEVEPSGTMQVSCSSFITKEGRRISGTALEFEKAIDWEQRRYEIAKVMLSAVFESKDSYGYRITLKEAATEAVSYADALIGELKKTK